MGASGDSWITTRLRDARLSSIGLGTATVPTSCPSGGTGSAKSFTNRRRCEGERGVADEGLTRIGTMLEELGARFELVVEAVSGFGGKVDKLKEEIFGQFAEVGSQIRFLSEQIGENRSGLNSLHSDFGAEMVRLNEIIGKARVDLREQLAASEGNLRGA